MTADVQADIQIACLTKRYRSITAVDDVTVDIAADTITGLLGRNGAGKTTLLQMIAGHILPTSGRVDVLGRAPYENAEVLRDVCFVRESQRYPSSYKISHVLHGASLLYPGWDQELADELVEAFELPRSRAMKKLSRGMRSAVGCIVGLASRAPLTMFDEPYTGLDAVARQLFYDRLLADYSEQPRTVVLSTHLIDEVSNLIEHAVVLDHGRVIVNESAEALAGRMLAVTGPSQVVDQFVDHLDVVRREELGQTSRVTVDVGAHGVDRGEARSLGLDVKTLSLQEFMVQSASRAHPDRSVRSGVPPREEER